VVEMNRKIMFVMLVLAIFLISGCTEEDIAKLKDKYEPEVKQTVQDAVQEALKNTSKETEIVCNNPYIRHADGCCLDKDSNNICDKDEEEPEVPIIDDPIDEEPEQTKKEIKLTEIQLTKNRYQQKNPSVWGNTIVWEDYRNGNSDIYMRDLDSDKEVAITNYADDEINPFIFLNMIFYVSSSDNYLYAYNINTEETTKINLKNSHGTAIHNVIRYVPDYSSNRILIGDTNSEEWILFEIQDNNLIDMGIFKNNVFKTGSSFDYPYVLRGRPATSVFNLDTKENKNYKFKNARFIVDNSVITEIAGRVGVYKFNLETESIDSFSDVWVCIGDFCRISKDTQTFMNEFINIDNGATIKVGYDFPKYHNHYFNEEYVVWTDSRNVDDYPLQTPENTDIYAAKISYNDIPIDDIDPTVSITHPEDGDCVEDEQITFFYLPTDENLKKCSIYVDDEVEISTTAMVSGQWHSLTSNIKQFDDGEHDWFAGCYDSTGNFGVSDTHTFEINNCDTVEDDPILDGDIEFTIEDIDFEENEDGNPWKLIEVEFAIDNQREDFRPRIKGYAYSADDPDEIKEILRIDSTFPLLDSGLSKTYKIAKFKSKYLSIDSSQTPKIYLQLYDADTGVLLEEVSKYLIDGIPTEEPDDDTTDDSSDDTTDLSGVVKFVIADIDFDENDDGDPWRLTEVMFSIDNQKEDFRPRIKGYAYASDDPDEIKEILRIDSTFPLLGAGLSKTYKITKFKSKYLSVDSTNDPKLYLQIYDADSGVLLKEAQKTIR